MSSEQSLEHLRSMVEQDVTRLFFSPSRDNCLPAGSNLSPVRTESFSTSAGQLDIWRLLPSSESSKTLVIHFHGSGYNVTSHYEHTSWLPDLGFEVIMFDYPGYGRSKGEANLSSVRRSNLELLTHLLSTAKPSFDKVILYCQSLGGPLCGYALHDLREQGHSDLTKLIDGFVVDSSIFNFRELASIKLSRILGKEKAQSVFKEWLRLAPEMLSQKQLATEFNAPILLSHSSGDSVIPFEFGEQIKKDLKQEVNWIHDEKCDHTDFYRHDIKSARKTFHQWAGGLK